MYNIFTKSFDIGTLKKSFQCISIQNTRLQVFLLFNMLQQTLDPMQSPDNFFVCKFQIFICTYAL